MNAVQSLVLVEKRDAEEMKKRKRSHMARCQKGQLVPQIGDKGEEKGKKKAMMGRIR
jgi:hypothetical protein